MWNDYFSALCDHQPDLTSGPLKRWANTQRSNKKILTVEEREALESIPGWKWYPTWDAQLAALREYVAANNKLPKTTHERLGIWIKNQRQQYKKQKLSTAHIRALQSISLWRW